MILPSAHRSFGGTCLALPIRTRPYVGIGSPQPTIQRLAFGRAVCFVAGETAELTTPSIVQDTDITMTVRAAVLDLLRAFGMTSIFGNPGSTELPLFREFPQGLPLRARPAGSGRRRHGGRLCAGDAQRRLRQSAFRGGRGSRDGQHLHRVPESHAARHHRGPAGALDPPVRPVPVFGPGHGASEAVREMELRAGARRGRSARHRARLLHRDAAAARTGAGFDSGRRLGEALRARRGARREHRDPARAARAGRDRRGARRVVASRLRRRRGGRSRRRLGRRRAARRAAQRGGVGRADVGALQLPRGSCALRRLPSADAREDRATCSRGTT